jgi:DNA-binding transcriptional LysR family regulator
MGEMERELSDANSAPRGKLRVALPLLGHLFAPAFSSFMVAYPNIELDLDFSDRIVDIVSDGFDVAIRTGEGVDSRLLSRRIGVYTMTLVASPNYLAERGMPASPSDLIGHACVHHRYSTTGKLERWPLRADDGADVIVPVTASISSVAPLLDMAESGCGIACLPDFIVKRGVREGRLIRLLDAYLEHENVFRVVWPSSRYIAPRLRVFIDHMADHVFPRQIGSTSTARRSS